MKKIVIVSLLLFFAQGLKSNAIGDMRNAANQLIKPCGNLALEGCSAMVNGAGVAAFLKVCVLPVCYGLIKKAPMPSSHYLTFSTAAILGLTLAAKQTVDNKKKPYQCPQDWKEEYKTAQKVATYFGVIIGFNTALNILSKLI